jgi:hypothetical protein
MTVVRRIPVTLLRFRQLHFSTNDGDKAPDISRGRHALPREEV